MDPRLDVFNRLLRNRVVMLGTDVNDDIANQICAQLLYLEGEDATADIWLYINSPGGSVTAGMAIYDTMQFVSCDVATVCMGMAASMGQFLLTAGAAGKRYTLPNARIMMHQPLAGLRGQATDIAIQAEQLKYTKRRMAERGANPIVAIGFSQGSTLEKVAKDFPKLQFAIIDSVVALPNVQSIVFKEHEGSFLVGMMAAMASKTGKVGFVGGMDIPLIRKFQCGYEQGAKYANPKAEVSANMTGTTPSAWNDPARGAELAKTQFSSGVDVVFAAAGGTGIGVYQAAKDAGKLAIGVDSNQNHLQPGTMLTSMVKRVDVAVYNAFKGVKPGVVSLGLKEGGVDYAMDEHNAKLVTADMKKKVDAAKADIVSGKIKVIDFMANNACK